MIKILSHAYLNENLKRITTAMPDSFRVNIKASKHFIDRVKLRSDESIFATYLDILECVEYNYPLILYYSELDTILPERGRLESDKYVLCGDIINEEFILRTLYQK